MIAVTIFHNVHAAVEDRFDEKITNFEKFCIVLNLKFLGKRLVLVKSYGGKRCTPIIFSVVIFVFIKYDQHVQFLRTDNAVNNKDDHPRT